MLLSGSIKLLLLLVVLNAEFSEVLVKLTILGLELNCLLVVGVYLLAQFRVIILGKSHVLSKVLVLIFERLNQDIEFSDLTIELLFRLSERGCLALFIFLSTL